MYDNTKASIGVAPQAASGTTAIEGAAVDTLVHKTLKAVCQVGATSGTPTSFTITFKVQQSADGSTGWVDVTGASKVISAVGTLAEIRATDYAGVDTLRYLRLVATPAFVGGSSPTAMVSGVFDAGNAIIDPQNEQVDVQAGSIIS